jgi:hypothetical protein
MARYAMRVCQTLLALVLTALLGGCIEVESERPLLEGARPVHGPWSVYSFQRLERGRVVSPRAVEMSLVVWDDGGYRLVSESQGAVRAVTFHPLEPNLVVVQGQEGGGFFSRPVFVYAIARRQMDGVWALVPVGAPPGGRGCAQGTQGRCRLTSRADLVAAARATATQVDQGSATGALVFWETDPI